jgi:hypothetical protein
MARIGALYGIEKEIRGKPAELRCSVRRLVPGHCSIYHLLIFCQSVPDSTAGKLIAQATKLNPDIKVLALSYDGEQRRLGTTTLTSDIYKPEMLRDAVVRLLSAA